MFSHDVTAAILASQNNETAAMLVSHTTPVGVELFSYANTVRIIIKPQHVIIKTGRTQTTYSRLPINRTFKGNLKKFRVIGSSGCRELEENSWRYGEKQFLLYCEHFNPILS